MAGTGPAPKQNKVRRNREPEKALIKADGTLRGFALPKGVLPEGEDWHSMTRRWWNAWRKSPQATRMLSEPDWFFLLDTALMHHQMWEKGRWDFASEVRLRVAKFGATPEDRLRLRTEIHVPEEHPVGTGPGTKVTDIKSRRARLSE